MVEYQLLLQDHAGAIKGFEERGMFEKIRQKFPWYDDEPCAFGLEDYYVRHHAELSTERRVDGGGIPGSEIRRYARGLGLDEVAQEVFFRHIRGLDKYLLEREAEKRERDKHQRKQAAPQNWGAQTPTPKPGGNK